VEQLEAELRIVLHVAAAGDRRLVEDAVAEALLVHRE